MAASAGGHGIMLGRHCPFTNRQDARCSAHFAVNRLQHAFDFCFGDYGACPSYQQLLSERTASLTIKGRHVAAKLANLEPSNDKARAPGDSGPVVPAA
jgi:hypothetical protein